MAAVVGLAGFEGCRERAFDPGLDHGWRRIGTLFIEAFKR
jgi:hypothetical protein